MSHICNYSFIMAFMALAQTVEASHKAPATLSSALVVKKFDRGWEARDRPATSSAGAAP